jgi:TolB protein
MHHALRRTSALALAAALAAVVAGCDSSEGQSAEAGAASKRADEARVALPGGRIAFRRYLDDEQTHGAIFTIRPDGSGEKQLTDPPAGTIDDHPDWSPDGKRIAFERCDFVDPCRVFTVAAAGGRPRQVAPRCELGPICDLAAPAWTPDGRLVATLAQGRERRHPNTGEAWIQQSAIVLFDLDKGTQRTVLERPDWTGDAGTPAFSPDGHSVLYRRWNSWRTRPADRQAMFIVEFDGTANRRLTPWRLGGGDHPGFAPDATILFRSFAHDETKQSDFWTVRPDGTQLNKLTHYKQGTTVLSASYSPDGDWIVHATNGVGGNADIHLMRADATHNQPVTRTQLWDSAPDWGPPGS